MLIGVLELIVELPGCASLKEKRSLIKPLIARLHREFNISVAETDRNDQWRSTVLTCAITSNDSGYAQKALQEVLRFVERNFPNLSILEFHIQMLH